MSPSTCAPTRRMPLTQAYGADPCPRPPFCACSVPTLVQVARGVNWETVSRKPGQAPPENPPPRLCGLGPQHSHMGNGPASSAQLWSPVPSPPAKAPLCSTPSPLPSLLLPMGSRADLLPTNLVSCLPCQRTGSKTACGISVLPIPKGRPLFQALGRREVPCS